MYDSVAVEKNSVSPSLQLPPKKGSIYLITGGTGSLGTALTQYLLSQGHRVRVYARNEHGHEQLEKLVPADLRSNLSTILGAVEDVARLRLACRGVSHVIHAAAQKVIPLCEYNPVECIQTNILGSCNVARACIDSGTVEKAVFISSDKARAPNTLYGASKLAAERVWLQANKYCGERPKIFRALAYGNVWGSSGSVLHAFAGQAQSGFLTITDPEMTRFSITMKEAVEFVRHMIDFSEPGTLSIPKLPSYKLGDLAKAFMRVYKLTKDPVITGRRTSEKLHEDLISENESCSCLNGNPVREYMSELSYYVLEPGAVHERGGWSYNSGSNTWRLSVTKLEEMVREWASSS